MVASRSRIVSAAGLAVAAALTLPLIGGCSDGAAPPPAADIGAASAGLRAGGTMTWAVDAAPQTLNVHQTDASAATRTVAEATLPVLFPLDEKGRPHADADYLAKAVATGPAREGAGQTVVYTLNPKARWSDGKPLSAADFAGQWKALRGTDAGYWAADSGGYNQISSVTAGPAAHQVKVVFAKPFADWRALFSPLYPAAATATPAAFNDGLRSALPAVAGPFAVAPRAAGDRSGATTLVRNPHWWGTRARLDKLVLRPVPAARRLAALHAGTVDRAVLDTDTAGGAALLSQVAKDRTLTLHRAAGGSFAQLTLNGGSGPLADDELRRTVARAIDRAKIAQDVSKPLGLTGFAPGSHLLLATQDGYSDNSSALGGVRSDPAAVTKALKAAGPLAQSADGRPAVLRVLVPKGSAQAATVASDVVGMLGKVGLKARTVAVPGAGYFTDHVAQGDFDLAVYSWPATAYPLVDTRALYAKPQPSADGTVDVGRNWARTGTDEIDLLYRKAGEELDAGKRQDLAQVLDARIWREAVSLPLYQAPEAVATRRNVAGAGAFGIATPDFTAIGFAK